MAADGRELARQRFAILVKEKQAQKRQAEIDQAVEHVRAKDFQDVARGMKTAHGTARKEVAEAMGLAQGG